MFQKWTVTYCCLPCALCFPGGDSHSSDLGKSLLLLVNTVGECWHSKWHTVRTILKVPRHNEKTNVLPSDSWRSHSATDGLKNGDANSSSLAAKGFRSVRPNLQDKKSPTQVNVTHSAVVLAQNILTLSQSYNMQFSQPGHDLCQDCYWWLSVCLCYSLLLFELTLAVPP